MKIQAALNLGTYQAIQQVTLDKSLSSAPSFSFLSGTTGTTEESSRTLASVITEISSYWSPR